MKREQLRHGFVLVDLLTTTLIIMLLAAILFPVFSRAREKARTAACQSNLQQIGMAMQVYAKDNYGRYPPTENDLTPLMPYLQEREVLHCPSQVPRNHEEWYRSYQYQAGHSHDEMPTLIIAYDRQRPIHNVGVNALWIDGHVKWMKPNSDKFKLGLEGKERPIPSYPHTAGPPAVGSPPGGPQGAAPPGPPPGSPSGGLNGAPPGMVPAPAYPPSQAPTPSKPGGKS